LLGLAIIDLDQYGSAMVLLNFMLRVYEMQILT